MIPLAVLLMDDGSASGSGGIVLSDWIILGTGANPSAYTVHSDGKVKDQNITILETWLGSGSNVNFQVKAIKTSGSSVTGTLSTWLACSSVNTWGLTSGGGGSAASLTITIRDAAAPNNTRATATITLS